MSLILTLNAGSSSIKGGLYAAAAEPREEARGQVEALGPAARLVVETGAARHEEEIGAADHATGLARLGIPVRVTEAVLAEVYYALAQAKVFLEGCVDRLVEHTYVWCMCPMGGWDGRS